MLSKVSAIKTGAAAIKKWLKNANLDAFVLRKF